MGTRILLALALFAVGACKEDPPAKPDATENTIDAPAGGACTGGTIGYLQTCTDASECGNCVCQMFGHSKKCTLMCTDNSMCPAPSPGCETINGVCRP